MSEPASPARLVVATRNKHKVQELRRMLAATGLAIEVLSLEEAARTLGLALPPDTVEDRPDFQGNAAKKAHEAALWAGCPAVADDSGLEVDAVGGQPGVLSARYGQDEWPDDVGHGSREADRLNNEKLLRVLEGVPQNKRTARFRSAVALADPTGALGEQTLLGDGRCEGRVLEAPRGNGGFGYDPIFYIDSLGLTFAEAPQSEKDRVSHRARAVADLLPKLIAYFRAHRLRSEA